MCQQRFWLERCGTIGQTVSWRLAGNWCKTFSITQNICIYNVHYSVHRQPQSIRRYTHQCPQLAVSSQNPSETPGHRKDYRPFKEIYPPKPEAVKRYYTGVQLSASSSHFSSMCDVSSQISQYSSLKKTGRPQEWRCVQDLDSLFTHYFVTKSHNHMLMSGFLWRSSCPQCCFKRKPDKPDMARLKCHSSANEGLMICSPTAQANETDTQALLKLLAANSRKASLNKWPQVKQVSFLGNVITGEGKFLSPKYVTAIQHIPKPLTKKQMKSFLGTTSYHRQWIPNYVEIKAQLSCILHGKGLSAHKSVTWTEKQNALLT